MTKATGVSAPSSGAIEAATAGSAGAFTVTNTASCGPSSAGSDDARTGAWWVAVDRVDGQAVCLEWRPDARHGQ